MRRFESLYQKLGDSPCQANSFQFTCIEISVLLLRGMGVVAVKQRSGWIREGLRSIFQNLG